MPLDRRGNAYVFTCFFHIVRWKEENKSSWYHLHTNVLGYINTPLALFLNVVCWFVVTGAVVRCVSDCKNFSDICNVALCSQLVVA